jgi:hypothetical protein
MYHPALQERFAMDVAERASAFKIWPFLRLLGLVAAFWPALTLQQASAQANTAAISISNAFVNLSGQAVPPPGGSAAGISFSFTPTSSAQPATVLTSNSAGQAYGALSAGSYTFQETDPAPGTIFLSATISQSGGQSVPLVPGVEVPFSPGGSYSIIVTDQVTGESSTGEASVTIYKSLATGSTQPAVGSLAGFSFTLTGQTGLPTQTLVTNQLGQAAFTAVPPGIYSISEAPAPGSTFSSMAINGVSAQQQQPFQVQAGGNYEVDVTNSVSGSGNISIQVQLVDQNGQPTSGNLAGFSFTLTPQGGSGPASTSTTTSSGTATANLAPGVYAVTESPPTGASLLSYTINGVSTQAGQFTVGLSQTTTVVAINRVTAATSVGTGGATGGRTGNLPAGCDNVASTFPDGTAGSAIAAAISPASSLTSIWKWDNASQTFHSVYFPPSSSGAQAPADIAAVNRLDPLFVCVSAPATFNEPST